VSNPFKALFQKAVNFVANEPVTVITTVVAGGITWLFSHFSFLPPVSDTTRNTVVTLVVALVGLIVRQFVTPTRKLQVAQKSADGQAHVVTTASISENAVSTKDFEK
jgi:hypothetical protein